MIVVASHDRLDLLKNMLLRLSLIDLADHQVLVVDTNSQDEEYLSGIQAVKDEYPWVKFDRKTYTCWDSGAYLHAYRNYPSDKYIFLQDSLMIENENLIQQIDSLLNNVDVVPIFNFKYFYDNEEERRWVEEGIEVTSLPDEGIFGPIFAVTKVALDRIPNSWIKEPTSKLEACGMERFWSLVFHLTGATKRYLEHIPHERWQDFWAGDVDFTKNIKKIWLHRK